MNFSKSSAVASCIELLKNADIVRAPNRALINDLFNGLPPYTEKEATDNQILVNINWKEPANLLFQARRQFENGFLKPGYFFRVTLPECPPRHATEYGDKITRHINKIMKGNQAYLHMIRSKFAGVCLHGIGPTMWEDQYKWLPYNVGIEDLLIPSNTLITGENLSYFAVRRRMTPGQLFRKTIARGKHVDKGWKMNTVKRIIADLKNQNQNNDTNNWSEEPERMAELFKQNMTWYDSDAVPNVKCWDFYYEEEEEKAWYRCMILDSDCANVRTDLRTGNAEDPTTFLYKSDKPFARNLSEVLHMQFGDGNNKPPFMIHSVRSLGWILFDTCHMMNRLRCQFTQHVFEQLMMLFRVSDPADRDRVLKLFIFDKGVIPEGVNIVPAGERFQINAGLVDGLMGNLKQLMGESSSVYTQDLDNGTQKERTKFEVQAILSQTSSLTASILNLAYEQETYAYREISRRMCLKVTPDFDAKKFRAACIKDGVPEKYLNVDLWDIAPERVLGAGNKQMEVAQAHEIMSVRPLLNPRAQAIALNQFMLALTDDPAKANELAPLDDAPHVTDTIHDTELVYGAFLQGSMVSPKPGLNPLEVIPTMLKLMETTVQQIKQTDGVGTPQQVMGLMNAAKYTAAFIQQLAQDKAQKGQVKQFMDALKNIGNEVKAFMQRQQEAQKAKAQQPDPETMAKIQADQAVTQQKLKSKEVAMQQKLQHNQQRFISDQQIKTGQALADTQIKAMQSVAGAERGGNAYEE